MIKKSLIYVFKSACILVTIGMVVLWIYKFYLNDDSTTIEYKLVKDINDIVQPELTINILDPIMNDDLQKILNITKDETLHFKYKDYLNGNENDTEKFKAVDYDKVTPNLFKYLEKIDFFWKRGTYGNQFSCTNFHNCPYVILKNNYSGMLEEYLMKSFGIQINPANEKEIVQMELHFNADLENVIHKVKRWFVTFNYPHQFLRRMEGSTLIWNHNRKLSNRDIFEIISFDILKRRNKRHDPCLSDWRYYDDIIIERHMEKVGCRAPYQKPFKNLSHCQTVQDIKRSAFDGHAWAQDQKHMPCQEMPDISFKHIFHYEAIPENETKKAKIWLQFPQRGKVISQSRAIDGQTLIGNIGGYIGLLLGA